MVGVKWIGLFLFFTLHNIAEPVPLKLSGVCNSYEREQLNEGYHKCVYRDSMGSLTVGVGFNFDDEYEAKQKLASVGANYTEVLNGHQCLNDTQIKALFEKDMADAVKCASDWMDKSWSSINENTQSALADMAFDRHLGCYTLFDFVNVQNCLSSVPPRYDDAANILLNSTWCGRDRKRCLKDVDCVKDHN